MRKLVTYAVVVATIVWSLGLAAVVPAFFIVVHIFRVDRDTRRAHHIGHAVTASRVEPDLPQIEIGRACRTQRWVERCRLLILYFVLGVG